MRFNDLSDVVTYFEIMMTKKGNTKNYAMSTLFDIMRLIRRGKSSSKKFPNNVYGNCNLYNILFTFCFIFHFISEVYIYSATIRHRYNYKK